MDRLLKQPPTLIRYLGKLKTIYLCIPVRFNTISAELYICADIGASSMLVSEKWLKEYGKKVCYETVNPCKVTGVNSTFMIDRKATFDFYISRVARQKAIYGHFTVTADIIPELGPNLLLGIDFLYAHGVKINTSQGTASFRSVLNMVVNGEVLKRLNTNPMYRQVTAYIALIIQPKQQALL